MVRAITGSPTPSELDLLDTPQLEGLYSQHSSRPTSPPAELHLPQIGDRGRGKVVVPPPPPQPPPQRGGETVKVVSISTSATHQSPPPSGNPVPPGGSPIEGLKAATHSTKPGNTPMIMTLPTSHGLASTAPTAKVSPDEQNGSSAGTLGLGVDPMHHEHQSAAALCAAAADGDSDVLLALLRAGHPAGKGDYDRRCPLHLASEEGHLECVQLLVEHGADINCCDRWGTTPLKGALHNLQNEVANFLRDKGAKLGGGGSRLDLTQNKRKARQWFEQVLLYSGLPEDSNVIPTVAIAAYLLTQHGIDVTRHTQLQGELSAMKRRPREMEGKTPYVKEIREWAAKGSHFVDLLVGMKQYETPESVGKRISVLGSQRKPSRRNTGQPRRRDSPGARSTGAEGPRGKTSGIMTNSVDYPPLRTNSLVPSRGTLHSPRTDNMGNFTSFEVPSEDESTSGFSNSISSMRVPLSHPMLAVQRGLSRSKAKDFSELFGKSVIEFTQLLRSALGDDVPDENPIPGPGSHTKASKQRGGPKRRSVADVPAPAFQKVLLGRLQINNWPSFVDAIIEIAASVLYGANEGTLPSSIPLLSQQDPDVFSVAVTTVDGQQLELGNTSPFTQQSAGMPFLYAATIEDYGEALVHSYIGQEPTGRSTGGDFDFALTTAGKPFNAVTSAGAVVTASLYHPEETVQDRTVRFLGVMRKLSGQPIPPVDERVYSSEEATSYRNHAIASFMMAEGCFSGSCQTIKDYHEHVSFYHRTCAAQNTCLGLATGTAALANYGTNPLTSERVFSFSTVKLTLQLAYSCGMKGSAGEWACTVGIPAKSGLAGAIWLCVPGVLGLCVRSPKLDQAGNSKRGVLFSKLFADRFQWGVMDLLYRARDAGTDA